jgi:hypothetical protein
MKNVRDHLQILHRVFKRRSNFNPDELRDYKIYKENNDALKVTLDELEFSEMLYSQSRRQMILGDFLEYIFLGRGYYSMKNKEDKERYVKSILHFVNLLMCYEVMTVSSNLRNLFLSKLEKSIPRVAEEELYGDLVALTGTVGLTEEESDAPRELNRYFDRLLPKTAGGLWHELLVYVFLLRHDIGHIIPLVLTQRFIGQSDNIVPPDYLIITSNKHIYGVEVGIKKEIQSGSFSIRTNIPTATIDTINSRTSDRCPICKRWIGMCPFVIEKFSNFDVDIGRPDRPEIKCLDDCILYEPDEIANGNCPYTKYRRGWANTLDYTHHEYADGYRYHYYCVLENVPARMKRMIIAAQDRTALKTHYPYYSGLEVLLH